MKKIAIIIFAFFLLFPVTASAEAEGEKGKRLALVEIDTGAVGSTVNYFVLRPLIEYDNEEGVAKGTMFDGVVFSARTAPTTATEAEGLIASFFKEGTCISAAETVAGEMKEDGFLGKEDKYPVYASVPYIGSVFKTAEEKEEFCKYYIDTLYGVFESKKYNHVNLTGVYFSADYDASPDLRAYCISIAKAKGLKLVVSSTVGSTSHDAMLFASNKRIGDQLNLDTKAKGYTLSLNGVPDGNSKAPFDDLKSDYEALVSKGENTADIMFKFRSFNDVYDCASAMENTVPNAEAREAYELLKQMIDDNYKPISALTEEKSDRKWLIILGIAVGVVVLSSFTYMLYKKGKNND